ncbi:hypothetical protein FOZG_17642 [Fusarium oxysporum Fo47]|uniref:Uncharacterized protein n=1 Tax=Fusarium oxysporum Fo47 TaxID=660027 RepID=W9J9A7_FUSOX|nr:hypothetical protein FOZG_17642 [Fusarium oxysporum Fo47]
MPANVNDTDILNDRILQPSTQPTQMSGMIFKISLLRLSARICKEHSDVTPLTEGRLVALDAEIASEQQRWASVFLVDGAPSLLDSSSYALSMLSPDSIPWSSEAAQEFETNFDDWIDNVQWLDPESIDWNFWEEILKSGLSEVPS